MRDTFTIILTVDRDNLRVGMESVYDSGTRISHDPSRHSSLRAVNEFIVLFLQAQTESFGERCIHLVKFALVEEPVNVN